ncbi:thiolase family protein [Embleya sp. NPDC001921]
MSGEVYVLDSVRTPRGGPAGLPARALVEHVPAALVARTGVDPARVDDVVLGCAGQVDEQGANPARTAVLTLGRPDGVPGRMINRFHASGIDAVASAAALVRAGQADLVIAGGVESSSRVPRFADRGPLWTDAAGPGAAVVLERMP